MFGLISASLALFFAASSAVASERATGIVFEDANENGVLDSGESGIPEVRVSNGRDIVRTGSTGRYEIDIEDGDVLFITKPSGYAVPLDENNLPQFHYVHRPSGSPVALRYRGVDPTGPLPASIDFALTRSNEPDDFTVVWLSDTQPQTWNELDYVRDDVISELVGVEAAFGITTGDIMFDDQALLPRQAALVAQIGIPWYNIPGNHEINFLAPNDALSMETFKRHFGPPYYSWDYGQAHFIGLDDAIYDGTTEGAEESEPRGQGGYTGGISEIQLEWLKNDLANTPKDKLVVLAMHIPFVSNIYPELRGRNVGNRDEVFELLKEFPHRFAVAGHMHTTYHLYFGEEAGFSDDNPLHQHVIATVSGSWWSGPYDEHGIPVTYQRDGTPNGYYFMDVRGTDVSMRFKPAGRPADEQMRVVLDTSFHVGSQSSLHNYRLGEILRPPIHVDQAYSTRVVANLYDGGPRSSVSYEIDGFEPVVMERVLEKDPFMVEHYLRFQGQAKSWVRAEPSEHLWAAPLPPEIGPGTHTITIRAVDEYGRSHVTHRVLEIFSH
jgi:hypothetical protein